MAKDIVKTLKCSSDCVIAAENDKDSRHVLFLASDQACASIHQLIQIFAIDRFNQNPATLGSWKIIRTSNLLYVKSTVIIDSRTCDCSIYKACIQTDVTFVGLVGDLSTLEIWSESQKINEVAKKDCLHLFILNI